MHTTHNTATATATTATCPPTRQPPLTLQELVRDDNCEQAALLLDLTGRSCRYRINNPAFHYECLLLACEWDRAAHTFRCVALQQLEDRDMRAARGCATVAWLAVRAGRAGVAVCGSLL